MSVNTSITEGGKIRHFSHVKALMVQGEDEKYYPWYPEEDRALKNTMTVDKNGVYQASKMGVYGWKSVNVNVPTTEGITGKDPDTGEEVYVHPDPEGELVNDVLPVRIDVTTPPTKTEYTDGEIIDYSGIFVHAYSAKGTDLGAVPFNGLVFPIKTAVYDMAKYQPDQATLNDTSFLYNNPPVSLPVLIGYGNIYDSADYNPTYHGEYRIEIIESSDIVYGFCYGYEDYEAFRIILCSKEAFKVRVVHNFYNEYFNPPDRVDIRQFDATRQYIHNGTGHFHYRQGVISIGQDQYKSTHYMTDGPVMWVNSRNLLTNTDFMYDTIEVILYGTILPGGNPIPVQWSRPGDGAILETTFTITVTGGD